MLKPGIHELAKFRDESNDSEPAAGLMKAGELSRELETAPENQHTTLVPDDRKKQTKAETLAGRLSPIHNAQTVASPVPVLSV